ncbi:MAG: Gfo/Idh/MocA family oxidoreductase [candidate division KSB1 bacterium]|nr:Gfo/Idh/MocA family oxidoreductase [candidate division KSB1 bacterium]MDZ7379632.1 Gfo/Idh/MocA family oxidoreductase [candidate division KSB1 bacterium]MDZ7392435.1 Gfo/Idh/MocA family oxidoreductase [candidate division KSB1 bacterium]
MSSPRQGTKRVSRPIKLGIIGTGLAARNLHWPVLKELPELFRVTAVCNRGEEKAADFAKLVGLDHYYLDYEEMVREADMEAVLVAVPIALNYPISLACARAGKHVMCEKPVAVDLAQGRKMMHLPAQYGVVVQIAEQFYYREDLQRAKELIQSGELGEVFQIRMDVTAKIDPNSGSGATGWRINPAHRGGFVTDAGVHHMAQLRLLGGEVARVHAFARRQSPHFGGVDNVCVNLLFRSGAIGHYSASYTATTRERWWVKCLVFGTKGTMEVGHGELWLQPAGTRKRHHLRWQPFDAGYRNQWLAFYRAIREGEPPIASPAQTYRDLQLILAALDAAERGEVTSLEEE